MKFLASIFAVLTVAALVPIGSASAVGNSADPATDVSCLLGSYDLTEAGTGVMYDDGNFPILFRCYLNDTAGADSFRDNITGVSPWTGSVDVYQDKVGGAVGYSIASCSGTAASSITVLGYGDMVYSDTTSGGYSQPDWPDNYVEFSYDCGYTVHSNTYQTVGARWVGMGVSLHVDPDTTHPYADAEWPISGASAGWLDTYPDDYGQTWIGSSCENLDVQTVSDTTVDPGESAVLQVVATGGGDVSEFTDTLYAQWPDGVQRFDAEPTNDPSVWQITMTRSAFSSPGNLLTVYVSCVDADGVVQKSQPDNGTVGGWSPDGGPSRPCSSVIVPSISRGDYVPAGSSYSLTVEVVETGVTSIVLTGGVNGLRVDRVNDPAIGVHTLTIPDEGAEWPLTRAGVKCFDDAAGSAVEILPGFTPVSGDYFSRPADEPPLGDCISGAGLGIDPSSWVPGLLNGTTCLAVGLFVPGEFNGGAVQADYEESTLSQWLEPGENIVVAATELGDADTADCAPSYSMPYPIPDMTLDMCDGPVAFLREGVRLISSFIIVTWIARMVLAKMEEAVLERESKATAKG